jgi:TRAP transporter 4TM/12TM fusion protein
MSSAPIETRRPGWLHPVSTVLQAVLVATVIAWVVDVQGKLELPLYTEQFLCVVLGLTLGLTFLIHRAGPSAGGSAPWYDVVAALAGAGACFYIAVDYPDLVNRLVSRPVDGIVLATTIVVLVLEATRRTSGLSMVLIVLGLCAYAMLGYMLPERYASRPVDLSRLVIYIGIDTNALLGDALQIAIIVVFPFIIMGQVLNRCGGSEYFADLSMALMGRYRGGSAKIAVVGSAFFGMVSGSAVANVASVGTITIPLMKRAGFPPHLAASIEAVGSTGGQLMPPVMGAAAFLMAEYLQVPYGDVMVAAIIPAFLYYAALFFQVDLEAARRGIAGTARERLPAIWDVLKAGWFFPVPFVFLVVGLLNWHLDAQYCAIIATAMLFVFAVTIGYRGRRLSVREALAAVVSSGGATIDVIVITAVSGLLIGVLNLTGVAFSLTMQLLNLSGGSMIVLLILTAIVALILGLGLPTVGVYVILATLAAPALVQAGLQPMQAHLYVLFHGVLSMVTPPVALAAFAAANIAQADQWKTGWTAMRIGWCSYFIPFLFAYSPQLLMQGSIVDIVTATLFTTFGIYMVTCGIVGTLRGALGLPLRLLCVLAGAALILPMGAFSGALFVNLGGVLLAAALIAQETLRVGLTMRRGETRAK